METAKPNLEELKARLAELVESRSEASCNTRNLSATDVQREQEIEDLEAQIESLETAK